MENQLLQNSKLKLHTFAEVQEVFFAYITKPEDRERIKRAYEFADQKHAGVFRKSGEPYIHHLLEVAYILGTLQAGPDTITAGFLHDVVEDTDVTLEDIKKMFGAEVAMLVDSVTKIQQLKLSHRTSDEFEAEDHRKIFLGMAKDIRVIIIKLADRLHNMRTLESLSHTRQLALSRETLEVFAPIAERLGMYKLKSELEDLCLKYLEPQKYTDIIDMLENRNKNLQKSLNDLKKKIADIVFEAHISFDLESRVKSIYSIYKKIYIKGHNFNEIYDILALRIITDTVLHCYEVLGLVHAAYKPIPGRFKDYIAMPKANLYQSLHTTIVAGDGQIFEVQIRTKEMDEIAETGVAAHWAYKEGRNYNPESEQREIEDQLHWFRDFINLGGETEGAKEYMDSLTNDIFKANVYVFTPKGKVVELPTGSTPLDFAYRIHTGVGDSAVGAVINGSLVPLHTILKTGDVVEIKVSKSSPGPNEGWLKIVQTASAKNHIRKFLMKKNADLLHDDHVAKGRTSAVDSFKDRGLTEQEMMEVINQPKVFSQFGVSSLDELFIAIANRNPMPSAIIEFLNIKKRVSITPVFKTKAEIMDGHTPVFVKNAGKVAITLGNCCTPIPGDDIVGYITKGKGITVHRTSCPNIATEKNRLVDVYWNDNLELAVYPVDIAIESIDRPNLLIDIMGTFSQQKVNLSAVNAKLHQNTMTSTILVSVLITDSKRLNDIFNILLNVTGVFKVYRVTH